MFQEPLIQFHLPGTVMNHPGTLLGHHRMTKNAGGYYKYFWTKMTQNGLTSLHNIHFISLTFNSSSVSRKNTGFLSSLRAILFFWSCSFRFGIFNLESCWFRILFLYQRKSDSSTKSIHQAVFSSTPAFPPPGFFCLLRVSTRWATTRHKPCSSVVFSEKMLSPKTWGFLSEKYKLGTCLQAQLDVFYDVIRL